MEMLQKLGWDKDLTDEERKAIDAVAGPKTNWKTDLSGGIQRVAIKHGCAPFGNAKARCVVCTFPDPVPLHREPIYTPPRDLLDKYATLSDRQRSVERRVGKDCVRQGRVRRAQHHPHKK